MKITYKDYTLEIIIRLTKHPNYIYEMIDAIDDGQTLLALKIYKEGTGLGLKDAKQKFDKIKEHYEKTDKIKTEF